MLNGQGFFESQISTSDLATAYASFLHWVNEYSPVLPEGQSNDFDPTVLGQLFKQAQDGIAISKDGVDAAQKAVDSGTGGSMAGDLLLSLKVIVGMLERLYATATAHGMEALAKGLLKKEDYKQILPDTMHALAHALQVPWDTEIEGIQATSEVKGCLEKLPTLEAAVSALESPVLKDNAIFDDTCGKCKSYTRMFVDGLRATTDSQLQALGDPLVQVRGEI